MSLVLNTDIRFDHLIDRTTTIAITIIYFVVVADICKVVIENISTTKTTISDVLIVDTGKAVVVIVVDKNY